MSFAEPDGTVPVALVDLGDTLAECTPALEAALARAGRAGDDVSDQQQRKLLLSTPGFWSSLAPRAAGFSLLALLRNAGYQVNVLTKGPRDAPQTWADKVAWCRKHLPGVPVIVTDDKTPVCGDVLVDDWLPYVERWQRRWPEALVIVPAQPWNAQMAIQPRRLRDDGNDRAALVDALRR
jgi:5'-nucleotidase